APKVTMQLLCQSEITNRILKLYQLIQSVKIIWRCPVVMCFVLSDRTEINHWKIYSVKSRHNYY
ncbi:MAG: hypothetical protein COA52_19690, partial [Hyphomicrobiales bacterium]